MSETQVQRWGTVPGAEATAKWALRGSPAPWGRGDEQRILEFISRQMDQQIAGWLTERRARYAAEHTNWEPHECFREAMLDLFCWQRRQGKPGEALAWLRKWEQGFESGRQENRKGKA
jgi:hypothetical protein